MTFQQAIVIASIGAGGAWLGYSSHLLSKKVAVGVGLGIGAVALVSAEFSSLEDSIPYVLGGGLAIGLAIFLL